MVSSSNVVVTYPNTPALICGYLRTPLTPLIVCHDVPNPRPTTFIRILRTGGPRVGVIDQPQITFESWAPDSDTAEANAQRVRPLINALVGTALDGHAISNVIELSGPGELPDPLSDSRRSTWSVQVWIRGI